MGGSYLPPGRVDEPRAAARELQAKGQRLSEIQEGHNRSNAKLLRSFAEEMDRFTGRNKPFPFLRLPREIRDVIYGYCLRADNVVKIRPQRRFIGKHGANPFKPPTSGLVGVNRQIYREAVEIMYSSNVFYFGMPSELLIFDQRIGFVNREQVREIIFWIRFPDVNELVDDPKDLLVTQYQSIPSHWMAALKECRLRKVVHLGIQAELLFAIPRFLRAMPPDLLEFIKDFLGRAGGDEVRRLSLKGFREDQRERFPKEWEVVMDQWDQYKEELRMFEQRISDGYWKRWGPLSEVLSRTSDGPLSHVRRSANGTWYADLSEIYDQK